MQIRILFWALLCFAVCAEGLDTGLIPYEKIKEIPDWQITRTLVFEQKMI
jgi:hypothetical protein